MRVFVAIRPSRGALAHLDTALEPVRETSGMTLRWNDPAQWHLTVAFSSDLAEGAVEDVVHDLAQVARATAPFPLRLAGAGSFGGRTLWIGVGGQTAAVESLMGAGLLGVGGPERHRAHLTVARVSARAPQVRRRRGTRRERAADPTASLLASTVHALAVYQGPDWFADELELVVSRPRMGRSGGPLHEVRARLALG